jgi:hypothetical protein
MEKKLYDVCVQEVWDRNFIVYADSKDQAREIANNLIESGDSDGRFEYSHTIGTDEWNVEDITSQAETIVSRGIRIDNKKGHNEN